MTPLEITATLMGRLVLPTEGYVHLDGILAWAVCALDLRPPALDEEQLDREIEIPIARSECGRYHLCSVSQADVRAREVRWLNKRFPVEWWQAIGGGKSAQRIQINAGPSKGFRVPIQATHLADDRLTWWCLGDAPEIERLLSVVTHVGRRRAVGEGEVRDWSVRAVEPWPGFPVWRDDQPLRALPHDDDRVSAQHVMRMGRLTFPYWLKAENDLVTVPHTEVS